MLSRQSWSPHGGHTPRWTVSALAVVLSSSTFVLRSQARTGRNRSAERTEVHLVATTSSHELTFCPSMRTSGVGKEVRNASQSLTVKVQPRSSQIPSKRPAPGSYPARLRSGAADPRISPALRRCDRCRNLQGAPAPQRCATRHCTRVRVSELGTAETTHRKAYALRSTEAASSRTD